MFGQDRLGGQDRSVLASSRGLRKYSTKKPAMPKRLTEDEVARYQREGYLSPLTMFDKVEISEFRQKLESFESSQGGPITGDMRSKSHLIFKWVDDIMRDDRILDPVEDLIGGDILCWHTFFWIKEPATESYVSWHQDLNYWGLDTDQLVTVWLALSAATSESGCMNVLPGSHASGFMPHRDGYGEQNMLTRGQEIAVNVDEAEIVAMPLQSGEASLHNGRLAHSSQPNRSSDRRIGLSFNYMPTNTRQTLSDWDSAALVRGNDAYGHFAPTPQPERDFDPVSVEFHKKAATAGRDIVYQGAEKVRDTH